MSNFNYGTEIRASTLATSFRQNFIQFLESMLKNFIALKLFSRICFLSILESATERISISDANTPRILVGRYINLIIALRTTPRLLKFYITRWCRAPCKSRSKQNLVFSGLHIF